MDIKNCKGKKVRLGRYREKLVIVEHVPEPLAKVLYPMMKKWTILSLKAKIDGEKR